MVKKVALTITYLYLRIENSAWYLVKYVTRKADRETRLRAEIWVERERRIPILYRYEKWLRERLNEPAIKAELERLESTWKREGELTLVCHCFPELCHADIIRKVIEERVGHVPSVDPGLEAFDNWNRQIFERKNLDYDLIRGRLWCSEAWKNHCED